MIKKFENFIYELYRTEKFNEVTSETAWYGYTIPGFRGEVPGIDAISVGDLESYYKKYKIDTGYNFRKIPPMFEAVYSGGRVKDFTFWTSDPKDFFIIYVEFDVEQSDARSRIVNNSYNFQIVPLNDEYFVVAVTLLFDRTTLIDGYHYPDAKGYPKVNKTTHFFVDGEDNLKKVIDLVINLYLKVFK